MRITKKIKEFHVRYLLILMILVSLIPMNGQENIKTSVSAKKILNIEFRADDKLDQLLVMIFDDTGKLMFMDSQKNFIGSYKQTVDLKKYPAGNYALRISGDKEKYTKTIVVAD